MARGFRWALVLALVVASGDAAAQAKSNQRLEEVIIPGFRGATMIATAPLGGMVLSAQKGVTITAVSMLVDVISGGGAATTVITVTDGTRNCLATFACNTTGVGGTADTGAKRVATTGTCTFPAGAALSMTVTTAGCTTTQPTARSVTAVGIRQ